MAESAEPDYSDTQSTFFHLKAWKSMAKCILHLYGIVCKCANNQLNFNLCFFSASYLQNQETLKQICKKMCKVPCATKTLNASLQELCYNWMYAFLPPCVRSFTLLLLEECQRPRSCCARGLITSSTLATVWWANWSWRLLPNTSRLSPWSWAARAPATLIRTVT